MPLWKSSLTYLFIILTKEFTMTHLWNKENLLIVVFSIKTIFSMRTRVVCQLPLNICLIKGVQTPTFQEKEELSPVHEQILTYMAENKKMISFHDQKFANLDAF